GACDRGSKDVDVCAGGFGRAAQNAGEVLLHASRDDCSRELSAIAEQNAVGVRRSLRNSRAAKRRTKGGHEKWDRSFVPVPWVRPSAKLTSGFTEAVDHCFGSAVCAVACAQRAPITARSSRPPANSQANRVQAAPIRNDMLRDCRVTR